MCSDSLYETILDYPYWRQRIGLDDGRATPGKRDADDWGRLGLPEDMSGKTFLDIGCSDGLHAFEAEKRGADKVLATDLWAEESDEDWWFSRTPRRRGFELVREYLDSDVSGQRLDVQELDSDTIGTYDVVLCTKVLPFVPCPADVVQRLVSVADEMLVVETATSLEVGRINTPALELAKATTPNDNRWWHPNSQALTALLEMAHRDVRSDHSYDIDTELIQGDSSTTKGEAIVESPVEVCQDYKLQQPVDEIPTETVVTVLARHESAVRIEYRHISSEPYRQGWVSASKLKPHTDDTGPIDRWRDLLAGIADYVRTGRASQLPRKAVHYFRYKYYDHPESNIRAHYRISD